MHTWVLICSFVLLQCQGQAFLHYCILWSHPLTLLPLNILCLLLSLLSHLKWVSLPALQVSAKGLALYKAQKIRASVLCRIDVLKAALRHWGKSFWKQSSCLYEWYKKKVAVQCCRHQSLHIKSLNFVLRLRFFFWECTDVFSKCSLINTTLRPKSLFQTV